MSSKSGKFRHGGEFPYDNLVERVSMSRDKLIDCFGEYQIADLRAGVNVASLCTEGSVPKANASVSSSSAGREEVALMRGPGNSFDSCGVVRASHNGRRRVKIPDHKFIIIPA